MYVAIDRMLGQWNYIISFSSTSFCIFMRVDSHYSLFFIQYFVIFGCVFLELIGTTQIINKKDTWLAFQGNNEADVVG